MTRYATLTAALLASTALGSAATADVTAEQVWAELQEMMAMGPGSALSVGGETHEGDTLVVTDVVAQGVTKTESDGVHSSSKSTVIYPEMRFTETSDGKVEVAYPQAVQIMLRTQDDEDVFAGKGEIRYEGLDYVISGEPDAMRHDFKAAETTFELTEITEGDATLTGPTHVVMTGAEGWMTQAGEELKMIEMDLSAEGVSYEVNIDADDAVTGMGSIKAINIAGTVAYPQGMDMEDDDIPEGLDVDISYKAGAESHDLQFMSEESGPESLVGTTERTEVQIAIDADALNMEATAFGTDVTVSVSDLPFDPTLRFAEAGMGIAMPISASGEPQPMSYKLVLDEISINDEVWDMFDPQGALPRDPATLRLIVSAMARATGDFGKDSDSMPVDPVSAKLEELTIDAAGLKVEGSGEVEFDETDRASYDGTPAPIGTLLFDISGANGLIDSLIKMGVVPQDQAMMGRMMLGMFTKPTGDDAVSAEITFAEGGQILANGQRVR